MIANSCPLSVKTREIKVTNCIWPLSLALTITVRISMAKPSTECCVGFLCLVVSAQNYASLFVQTGKKSLSLFQEAKHYRAGASTMEQELHANLGELRKTPF